MKLVCQRVERKRRRTVYQLGATPHNVAQTDALFEQCK